MKSLRQFSIFCLLFIGLSVAAQDLNNLSAVNVDELSDEQVQQFLDRAKESGMTLDQLEILAQQRGMPASQISKLRSRIRQIQTGTGQTTANLTSPINRLRESQEGQEDYSFFDGLKPEEKKSQLVGSLEIFGSSLFSGSETAFEPPPNSPTPDNYVLGPGDEVIIDVYGSSEITYQELISPDGRILIGGIGPISLAGTSINQAKRRIFNKLSSIYSGLKGENPNTFLQVSLGQIRSIKVSMVGNVQQPGSYTLSSLSTVFNALYYAGGPDVKGSMRSIRVFRRGKVIATFDLYKFLQNGDIKHNPQLQEGDVILVDPYHNRVKFAGHIKNPAVYELLAGESLEDLIRFSGGFTEEAFKESLTIDRVGDREKKISTVLQDSFANELMANGDSIFVTKILDTYANRVQIEGAVKRPGYFELTKELTLSSLLDKAEGLREDAYLKRGNIIRLSDDLSLNNIAFDVKEVSEGNQDFLLSKDDYIYIPSIFDLEEEKTIAIHGQVRNPGSVPFISGMTVEDLINISGGLKEDASTATVEVARRLSSNEDLSKSSEIYTFSINDDYSLEGASDFELKPFDLVLIKSTPYVRDHKVVKVEGEVNFPGLYALNSNEERISDLIKRAGGITQFGYAEGAILIRQTEYYLSNDDKRTIEGQVNQRREELEAKYEDSEEVSFIERQLVEYEKKLTEDLKSKNSSSELDAKLFRAEQMRGLLSRDSISTDGTIGRQSIGIELSKIIENPGSKYDIILLDGDLISIPKELETVRVQGEVLFPNTVRYQDGMNLRNYISASGGFSSNAKVGKTYIVYANGSAKRTSRFFFFKRFPKVKPGADIIIPHKELRRRLTIQEILGITSSLVTIALIIDRLTAN